MRTFVAIDLPKEVKDYLFDIKKKVKNGKIGWTAKKNLHLTLKFFGELSESKVVELKEILKDIKFKPFKVKLNKIGIFPNEDNIKIIWVDLKPDKDILELQRKIDENTLNISSLETKFPPHITLGRVKVVKNKEELKEYIKEIKIDQIEFEVKEFKLFKSTLSKDGPSYELLDTFK